MECFEDVKPLPLTFDVGAGHHKNIVRQRRVIHRLSVPSAATGTYAEFMALEIHAATPDRWGDIEQLFGPRGQQGGCWCMWNRQTSREFDDHKGDQNKAAFRALVDANPPPGLLAYADGVPVGWVAVAPRHEYPRLQRSRVTKPVDDMEVWAITCFVIARHVRGTGVATALLGAAVEFAQSHDAIAVEGYPVEPRADHMPEIYAWMGLASMFERFGFEEVARRSETRPLMRKVL